MTRGLPAPYGDGRTELRESAPPHPSLEGYEPLGETRGKWMKRNSRHETPIQLNWAYELEGGGELHLVECAIKRPRRLSMTRADQALPILNRA